MYTQSTLAQWFSTGWLLVSSGSHTAKKRKTKQNNALLSAICVYQYIFLNQCFRENAATYSSSTVKQDILKLNILKYT